MSNAPVPRQPDVVKILTLFNKRIRRLEVGRTNIRCGIALYTAEPPDTPAATWTPSFSSMTQVEDTIGCSAVTGGLVVPPMWFWWACVVVAIHTSIPPPTGDALTWCVLSDADFGVLDATAIGEYRNDILYDTSGEDSDPQLFGATTFGASGGYSDGGVFLPEMGTVMGTEFTPGTFGVAITGIQLFTAEFPHSSDGG